MEAMDCQRDGVVLACRKGTNGQERPETIPQFATNGCQKQDPCDACRSGEPSQRAGWGFRIGNPAPGSRDSEISQSAGRLDRQADSVASQFTKIAVCACRR